MPLKPILTQKYLQECFDYVDGKLIWKVRPLEHFKTKRAFSTWNTRFAGKTAGYLHSSSYTKISLNGQDYFLHRLIWMYHTGYNPIHIDHIDHNPGNNSVENLREVTVIENHRNMSLNKNNTSGVTGVFWHASRNKWMSGIMIKGKNLHLGYFTTLEEATAARQAANIKYNFHPNHGT